MSSPADVPLLEIVVSDDADDSDAPWDALAELLWDFFDKQDTGNQEPEVAGSGPATAQ